MREINDTADRGGRRCPRCGAVTGYDDRFCRACGTPLTYHAGPPGRGGSNGLRALGIAVIALALLFALFYYGSDGFRERTSVAVPMPVGDVGSAGQGDASQPLTARQSADLLYNRAMAAYETGDSSEAREFLPMALAAYRGLESLDLDARYHVALLNLAANLPQDALAQADTMLAEVPDHLLALSAAAEAYAELGDEEAAVQSFRRFLKVYTAEAVAARPEYLDHARGLPSRREAARRYLEEHGALNGQ
jgi:tetratricopeptide (TPR) repeat protein